MFSPRTLLQILHVNYVTQFNVNHVTQNTYEALKIRGIFSLNSVASFCCCMKFRIVQPAYNFIFKTYN